MMVTTLIKMGIDRKQDEAAKVFGSMVKISQEQADLIKRRSTNVWNR